TFCSSSRFGSVRNEYTSAEGSERHHEAHRLESLFARSSVEGNRRRDGNQLTILELQEAEKRWVKEVQVGAFPINRIEAGSTELPKSSPIASLCSFLEMEGLLLVGGRLTNVVRRCPGVINTPGLPNDGMIVALIVQRTQLTTKIMDSNLATK
ncbi:hypothetical protein T05_7657, partial [Trichinella murrelli]